MKYLLLIVLLFASTAYASPESACKANCTYRDRVAYYVDKECVARCIPDMERRIQEEIDRRDQQEVNRAIINFSREYRRNSEHYRREGIYVQPYRETR